MAKEGLVGFVCSKDLGEAYSLDKVYCIKGSRQDKELNRGWRKTFTKIVYVPSSCLVNIISSSFDEANRFKFNIKEILKYRVSLQKG